ncbi:TetR/AcrR family transcriptional regulator [Nocardia spumae]|uniref:TetR/AcrR family transcriptional regulator n=1 Tax=Nocardia spumae TaxID=2887190 RepID=UPI001D1385B2|nr:TetR/AcrR family transcriptional regulator [Nocardia spumae]
MSSSAWSVRAARERSDTDRHHALLDAAAEIFIERGYAATTVAAITARAGVSRATLYVYFASKDEIFHALAVRIRDEFLAAQEPGLDSGEPRNMLRATIESFAAAVLEAGPLLRLIEERGAVDPALAALAAEISERPIRRFVRYLRREQRAGTIVAAAPVPIVAETIGYALTQGILARRDDPPAARARYLTQLRQLAETLLGLRPGPGDPA